MKAFILLIHYILYILCNIFDAVFVIKMFSDHVELTAGVGLLAMRLLSDAFNQRLASDLFS